MTFGKFLICVHYFIHYKQSTELETLYVHISYFSFLHDPNLVFRTLVKKQKRKRTRDGGWGEGTWTHLFIKNNNKTKKKISQRLIVNESTHSQVSKVFIRYTIRDPKIVTSFVLGTGEPRMSDCLFSPCNLLINVFILTFVQRFLLTSDESLVYFLP